MLNDVWWLLDVYVIHVWECFGDGWWLVRKGWLMVNRRAWTYADWFIRSSSCLLSLVMVRRCEVLGFARCWSTCWSFSWIIRVMNGVLAFGCHWPLQRIVAIVLITWWSLAIASLASDKPTENWHTMLHSWWIMMDTQVGCSRLRLAIEFPRIKQQKESPPMLLPTMLLVISCWNHKHLVYSHGAHKMELDTLYLGWHPPSDFCLDT